MPVRILLADPQPLFARSVAWTLARHPNIDAVGWTTDEHEALAMIETNDPDLVLTEIDLARGSGLRLARRIRQRPDVAVLTRRSPAEGLLDAVSVGALGWLSHDVSAKALANIIAGWTPGRFLVDVGALHQTLRLLSAARTERAAEPSAIERLTPREREVLMLVAQGLDNASIGVALYVSPDTVRTHVGNILRKLGVHDRAEAARLALEAGVVPTTSVLRLRGPSLETR